MRREEISQSFTGWDENFEVEGSEPSFPRIFGLNRIWIAFSAREYSWSHLACPLASGARLVLKARSASFLNRFSLAKYNYNKKAVKFLAVISKKQKTFYLPRKTDNGKTFIG